MNASDRFYLTKGAVGFGKVRIAIGVIIGLFALIFGCIMTQSQTDAGLVLMACGVFFLGVAFFLARKGTGTRKFVELTAQGINLNGKKFISWDDIEKVEEEEYEEEYELVKIKKKKLIIFYANRLQSKMAKEQIISDYENYLLIKDKIYKKLGK